MKIFLIRHGNTDWSDTHKHTGRTDLPLNPAGESAARQLAPRLAHETFSHIFTSPLARARQTCRLAGFGDRAQVNDDLAEWNYGHFEGLTTAHIHQTHPHWNLFRDGAPAGESPSDVATRADRFLALARTLNTTIAVFSHGHLIRMLAARWLGLPPLAAQHFYNTTASISILGYEHDESEPVILLWNETRGPV
jgi:broad specificity phosphatase PhoE